MLKMLKLYKERGKIQKYANDLMKISVGIEKLAFFVVLFIILNHIWSCLWVIVGDYEEGDN
jgi:succinate dehydrogenase hydrophobic anchor subunit